MSFRTKAKEIKQRGDEQRDNYTPRGKPLDVYNWWLHNGVSDPPARENFCHFWRVVCFWAPIDYVLIKFDKVTSTWQKIALAIAVYLGLALLLGAVFSWLFPIFLIGIPILVVTLFGIGWAIDKFTPRPIKRFFSRHGEDISLGILAILAAGCFGFLAILLAVNMTWTAFFIFIGVGVGLLVTAGIVVLVGIKAESYIEGARAARLEEKYAYLEEHGEYPTKSPGRIKRFFSGMGDFLVLIAQIVRVKKWKICPLVTIDKLDTTK